MRAAGQRFAERLAEVGVPLVPVGHPVHPMEHGSRFRLAADVLRRAAELVAAQFDTSITTSARDTRCSDRMPDLDLVTPNGPLRVFTLLYDARPLLLKPR